MKRLFFIAFVLGCVFTYWVTGFIEKELPEAFEITRGGKVVGYADTRSESSEFTYIGKAKSPGIFIAFPIFGDQKEIQSGLS